MRVTISKVRRLSAIVVIAAFLFAATLIAAMRLEHADAEIGFTDFNGVGFSDLAIGIPNEAFCIGDFVTEDGAVSVIYGSSGGLSATAALADQIHSQSNTLKGSSCEVFSDDELGSALASGDFNNDGRDDLAIGVPGEGLYDFDDESIDAAGSVNVIYGSTSGLSASAGPGTQVWNRHTPSIEGNIAAEDSFGFVLATG